MRVSFYVFFGFCLATSYARYALFSARAVEDSQNNDVPDVVADLSPEGQAKFSQINKEMRDWTASGKELDAEGSPLYKLDSLFDSMSLEDKLKLYAFDKEVEDFEGEEIDKELEAGEEFDEPELTRRQEAEDDEDDAPQSEVEDFFKVLKTLSPDGQRKLGMVQGETEEYSAEGNDLEANESPLNKLGKVYDTLSLDDQLKLYKFEHRVSKAEKEDIETEIEDEEAALQDIETELEEDRRALGDDELYDGEDKEFYIGEDEELIDGEDEATALEEDTCRYDHFTCVSDKKCIGSHLRCDGTADCTDGSDEFDCRKSCKSNGVSYPHGTSYQDYCGNGCHCWNGHGICTKMGCWRIPHKRFH